MRKAALYLFAIFLCNTNPALGQSRHHHEQSDTPFSYLDEIEGIEVGNSSFDEEDEDILTVMNSEVKYIFSLSYEALRVASEGSYLNRVTDEANGTELVAQELGEYKAQSSFSGTLLVRYRESRIYFGLKARLLRAKKYDKYTYQEGTGPLVEGSDCFIDTTIDIMPGGRFHLFDERNLKIHVGLFTGITWTESDWILLEGAAKAESDYQLTTSLEIGTDYLLNRSFAIGFLLGYDYKQARKVWPKNTLNRSRLTLDTDFSALYIALALSLYL